VGNSGHGIRERSGRKLGGRKKGKGNKATESIKTLLNRMLPEEELEKLWNKKLR
jgi:hypothetical protein